MKNVCKNKLTRSVAGEATQYYLHNLNCYFKTEQLIT